MAVGTKEFQIVFPTVGGIPINMVYLQWYESRGRVLLSPPTFTAFFFILLEQVPTNERADLVGLSSVSWGFSVLPCLDFNPAFPLLLAGVAAEAG